MSLQEKTILPTEWFNSQFSKIINHRIVNPPYNENFSDKVFFLQKRYWIVIQKQLWTNVYVSDIVDYTDSNKEELIVSVEDWSNTKVYNFDKSTGDLTLLLTKSKWNSFNFLKVLWWWQAELDTWTATWGTVTTLIDTSQSWDVNEFAWNYVFIKDWTWTWQLWTILSNTSDTLTVWGFEVTPTSWSEYQIYEALVDNIVIWTDDWVYKYDWMAFEKINEIANNPIDDMAFWKRRLRYTNNWNLYFSEEWNYFDFDLINYLNIWDKNIIRLYPYWDTLLVLTKTKIYSVRENMKTDDWTTYYSVNELTSNVWLFSRDSIMYDKWLYFVASDKRFYSMSLEIIWTDYYAKLEEQGSTIYNYLKVLEQWVDEIWIAVDVNSIYIYVSNWEESQEYVFNYLYKWWLVNNYAKNIRKKKMLIWSMYVLWKWYIWVTWWYTDWGVEYWTSIEAIIWQETIFAFKQWQQFNILVWKSDYIQKWELILEWQIMNKKYISKSDLWNASYFEDISEAISEEMWTAKMWTELYWWKNELAETISDIEVISKAIAVGWLICKVTINSSEGNWISFGWIQTQYVLQQGALKYYKNFI